MNNKKIKNYLKTFSLFLLVVTIITQTIFTSYASSVVPVATDSNAMDIDIYDSDAENNISTLSMTGGAMTAVQWLWALILSICGVSVTDTSAIDNLAADITSWASQAGKPNIYAQLIGEILSASWGATVSHLKDMVSMVKDYFRTKTGYGTSSGINGNKITAEIIPDDIFKWSYSYCYRKGISPSDYGLNPDNYLCSGSGLYYNESGTKRYDYFFPDGYDRDNYKIIGGCGSSYSVRYCFYDVVNDVIDTSIKLDALLFDIQNGVTLVSKIPVDYMTDRYTIDVPEIDKLTHDYFAYPFPVLTNNQSAENMLKWVHQPNLYSTVNWADRIGTDGSIWNGVASKVNIPINSVPSVQQKELDTAGSLTIPADTESAQAVINNANQAIDVDAIIEALKEYVDITYKVQGDITDNTNVISQILSSINEKISHWNIDNWSNSLKSVLNSLGIDVLSNTLNNIAHWDIDSWINNATNIITNSLNNLGINDLTGKLDSILSWDFADWSISLPESLKKVIDTPLEIITVKISNLANDIVNALNLSSLIDGIKEKILDGTTVLENIYDYLASLSIGGLLSEVIQLIKAIPKSIVDEINLNSTDKGDENDKSFRNFIDFMICLVYIILLLIMIFANCIRLIIAIFNIPATSLLFNDDVIKGLQYTKDLIIPKLNISLYSLLISIAFFLCVMSIIGVLKKRIDKLHE